MANVCQSCLWLVLALAKSAMETYMTQVYTDVLANCPCLPSPTARTVESNFYLNLWFVLLHNSVLAKFNTV